MIEITGFIEKEDHNQHDIITLPFPLHAEYKFAISDDFQVYIDWVKINSSYSIELEIVRFEKRNMSDDHFCVKVLNLFHPSRLGRHVPIVINLMDMLSVEAPRHYLPFLFTSLLNIDVIYQDNILTWEFSARFEDKKGNMHEEDIGKIESKHIEPEIDIDKPDLPVLINYEVLKNILADSFV